MFYEKRFISNNIKFYRYTRLNYETRIKIHCFPPSMQIVYKDGLLYVYASNEESRCQWLKALQKGNEMLK
jgi:hypothetical protein